MQDEVTIHVAYLGQDMVSGAGVHAAAVLLPLIVSFGLARTGQVRAAWMLPLGLFVLGATFAGFGLVLGEDFQAVSGAVATIVTLAAAAVFGGLAGVLLGRRRRA